MDLIVGTGDRFLMYTDGVLEADQRGEEFGEARVKRILAQPLSAATLHFAEPESQRMVTRCRGRRRYHLSGSNRLNDEKPIRNESYIRPWLVEYRLCTTTWGK